MGGPCFLKYNSKGRKQPGPECTDNFLLRPFEHDGATYHSCEHAYQALKFPPGPHRVRVAAMVPFAGESGRSHGMRCWNEGQRGLPRSEWDRDKVATMLAVNRSKYAAHADLREQLLATGGAEIVGGASTGWRFLGGGHKWEVWNGRVQMLLREELRASGGRGAGGAAGGVGTALSPLHAALLAHFEGYPEGTAGPPLPPPITDGDGPRGAGCGGGGSGGNLGEELASLAAFGLALPWVCSACTFENASFPQLCEACESPNPKHAQALAARRSAVATATSGGSHSATENGSHAAENGVAALPPGALHCAAGDPAPLPRGPGASATAHPAPQPPATAGEVVVCVGDLHGCLAEVQSLWRNLAAHLGGARQLRAASVVFLGDYVDRGPDSRGVLDWLVALQAARAREAAEGGGGGTHFLCGNHDFAMAAYLGDAALPSDRCHSLAELDATTRADFADGFYYDPAGAKALAAGALAAEQAQAASATRAPVVEKKGRATAAKEAGAAAAVGKVGARASDGARMHYQGRRWGGSTVYDSAATFESYGAGPGDLSRGGSPAARARLQAAVPAAHQAFLRGLSWAVDLAVPFAPGRLVAVHAGLAHGGAGGGSAEAQLAALKARDFTDPALHASGSGGGGRCDPGRLGPLSGRSGVRAQHPDFDGGRCLLVSGHHHTVALEGDNGHRLVLDNCGGMPGPSAPLQALVLPSRALVSSSVEYPAVYEEGRRQMAAVLRDLPCGISCDAQSL